MIIFHDKHSRKSRLFTDAYGSLGTVVNVHDDDPVVVSRYFVTYGIPRRYPAVADEDTKVVVCEVENPIELQYAIIDDAIEDAQERLKGACMVAITGGIRHSALGSEHFYATEETDQVNLNASVTAAKIYGEATAPYLLWCADENGVWARRDHSPAQIEAVGLTVMGMIRAAQNHYESKLIELSQAATLEEIEAIEW